jgi:hypothetical protein
MSRFEELRAAGDEDLAYGLHHCQRGGNRENAVPSLQLTDLEADVLRAVLESYMKEVSTQISNTEKYELRQQLKVTRDTIQATVQKLKTA